MKLQQATRKRAKIRALLQGSSGSGKTYSSLLLAHGLIDDWTKIAVIDSENHSADLYSHLGSYQTLSIEAPFTPEKYIEAIKLCEKSGIEVLIIDSLTHEWDGTGGILDIHGSMPGNSFTNWNRVGKLHDSFVQTILQSPCHIIATVRSKQDYVLTDKGGKQVPEKVGLKSVQRDGLDYEFTVVFELDIKQHATASKDRTSLFINKAPFIISNKIGEMLLKWCNEGDDPQQDAENFSDKIRKCKSIKDLEQLYRDYPIYQNSHKTEFVTRKKVLHAEEQERLFNHVTRL